MLQTAALPPYGARRLRRVELGGGGGGGALDRSHASPPDHSSTASTLALIGEQRPSRISWFCGGALLNERFVATAAHCLGQFQKNRLLVRVGDFDLHYDTDAAHQDLLVDRIYLHPAYEHYRKHNDLALLRLSTAARLGPLVRPVCLPPAGVNLTGQWTSLAGWGHTDFGGESSAVLQEVRLPLVDTATCEAHYRTLGNNFQQDFAPGFGDTKICAHDTTGHDCGLVTPTVRADFDELELRRRRRRRALDRSHASPPDHIFDRFDARQYDTAEYDPDFAPYTEPPPAEYRRRVSQQLGEVQFITGGQDAIIGRWPWIALIGEQRPSRISWFCGGALLNERFVATAAHCLGQFQKNRLLVRVGDFDLHYDTDAAHQDLLVDRIYLHPAYEHYRKHNDLALLRLSTAARLGPLVRPVCLPPAGVNLTGQWTSLAGWGHTDFGGESSAVLQEVRLPLVDTATCEAHYRTLGNNFQQDFAPGFGDTKICAHDTTGHGRDSCQGDSGGPMTFRDPASGRVQLVGIVSTGVGCGHPTFPGVYTRVAMYVDWIRQRAFGRD
ncbi:coagulation factor X-like [Pollicipes pollicipes]|uniref:coagulation factor X-like n=1 Tax=Pollicipes pollicipes TaxID=41117 RepID=UPI00188560FD|nr:coagulation factor X-like [Pollicipes pollicipes]